MLLITGSAGFLGQHLTRSLSAAGIRWRGLDRRSGDAEEHIVADVRKINRLDLDPRIVTELIHLASPVGVRTTSWDDAVTCEEIIDAANAVATFANRSGCRVLLVSSSEVYGEVGTIISKATPINPRSGYARGKAEAEKIILKSVAAAVVVRPFNIYGPGQRSEFIVPTIIECALAGKPIPLVNEGRGVRQLTYVADFTEAVLRIRQVWSELAGKVINVAGPDAITIRELAQLVARMLDRPDNMFNVTPDQVGRNPSTEISIRRVDATTIHKWKPRTSIEDGMRLTLAAYRHRVAP